MQLKLHRAYGSLVGGALIKRVATRDFRTIENKEIFHLSTLWYFKASSELPEMGLPIPFSFLSTFSQYIGKKSKICNYSAWMRQPWAFPKLLKHALHRSVKLLDRMNSTYKQFSDVFFSITRMWISLRHSLRRKFRQTCVPGPATKRMTNVKA